MRPRIGPLTTMSGAEKCVDVETPWRLRAGSQAHLLAAMTTGRYSGRHPASTVSIAAFSMVNRPPVVRRHFSEQFAWRASGTREHPFDALPGRRHDRESVDHAFVEPDLEFVRRHRVRCELAATISDNSSRADDPLNGSVSEHRLRDDGG